MNKNYIWRMRLSLCIVVCASFFSTSTTATSVEPTGLNHSPPPDYIELLKSYAAPGERGGVLACSKKLCERVGVPITKDNVLEYDGELGVEFYVESAPVLYTDGILIPPGFNCRVELFFPADWDVYVPNRSASWREVSPSRYSKILAGTREFDSVYLRKNHTNRMYVHSYIEIIKNAFKNKSDSYAESMRATAIVKEIIPGLSMVELKKRCEPISPNDQLAFYLPRQNAYPNGPGTAGPELTDEYFHQVYLPQWFSIELSKLFKSN